VKNPRLYSSQPESAAPTRDEEAFPHCLNCSKVAWRFRFKDERGQSARLRRVRVHAGGEHWKEGSPMFSVELIEQRRVRGARVSRTRCLASRQTHSGLFSLRVGESEVESTRTNPAGSGARDAPHGDRDDRAPQSLQSCAVIH